MIVVSVRLVSAISSSRDKELARMEICNEGGDERRGDYGVRILRGRDSATLDRRTVHKTGKVLNHARLALHVWTLVAKALAATGYVDTASPKERADL